MVARRRLVGAFFDIRFGVRTTGHVDLRDLDLHSDDRVDYQPSGLRMLGQALRKIDVCESDVFLDLGSGKGRIVLQAARYPFRRVLGVEISPQLHRIAERNLQRRRKRLRCGEVVLVNSAAETYDIPDDVSVVYMFNPFCGTPFAKVVRALVDSHDRNPRPLRIIYHHAQEEDVLLATGRVVPVWTLPSDGARPSRIYRVVPRAQAARRSAGRHPPG